MSFFQNLIDNPILLIFALLSLGMAANAVRLANTIYQRWPDFVAEPLLTWKIELVEAAAFLLAVPPGVIVHEFGHALATWLFGGQIVDVGFGLYWGYVVPAGTFTPAQDWFISLAGTLGTLLYGLALWLLLRGNTSSTLNYFGLRAFRFQLYYGLIYYPVFTLLTVIGDWRTIYDFQATPLLSGATVVVHLILLGLFWWADRRGRFEIGFDLPAGNNPITADEMMEKIGQLLQRGAINQARSQLKAFLAHHPTWAAGYLQLASLESTRLPVPAGAVQNARKALSLGLSEPQQIAFANSLLAQYELEMGHFEQAVRYLDESISLNQQGGFPEMAAHLHYLRAWAYRRWGKYELASTDIEQAIGIGESSGREVAPIYKHEQKLIRHHASQNQ